MSGHTPGEWFVEIDSFENPYVKSTEGEGNGVVLLPTNVSQRDANVQLASAAPDLLEAARHAVMVMDTDRVLPRTARRLERAIEKAEWRS